MCGKTAKDHRMNSANTRASQHRHNRFGHHRHVNNHPITFGDALGEQRTGEAAEGLRRVRVRDLWARNDLGEHEGGYSAALAPRDVALLRLTLLG